MITLDGRDGQNVHDAATWAYLWRLAASGRVIAVLGGTPCRTVSRLLEKLQFHPGCAQEMDLKGLVMNTSTNPNNKRLTVTLRCT